MLRDEAQRYYVQRAIALLREDHAGSPDWVRRNPDDAIKGAMDEALEDLRCHLRVALNAEWHNLTGVA